MSRKGKEKKRATFDSSIIFTTTKHARIAKDPTDFYEVKPAWRITNLQMSDPFGWHALNFETLQKIQERLVNFETMTWREILIDGKKRNHTIPILSLCKEAQKKLKELEFDDYEEILSLGVGAKERIFGFRENHILSLVWWDPCHNICPSLKKHT